MTLHEAIKRCERLGRSHYVKGAEDFAQIADWLKELEELRNERDEEATA